MNWRQILEASEPQPETASSPDPFAPFAYGFPPPEKSHSAPVHDASSENEDQNGSPTEEIDILTPEFPYAKDAKAPATLDGNSLPLEAVLKGTAIELWSDVAGERLWLVADEEDARKVGERRGSVYTAHEARRVVQINDPALVREIHRWKRAFNGRLREVHKRER